MSKQCLLKRIYFDFFRVTAVGVLLILTLIISINSFSWFSKNVTVQAKNMSISIKTTEGYGLEASSYYINNIAQNGPATVYTVAAATESAAKKIIPTYDVSSIVYNEYEKALALKFTVTDFAAMGSNTRLRLTTQTQPADYEFLSNYVKVGLVTGKTAIANSEDFNLGVTSYQSFVTINNNQLDKTNTLTFDIDLSALQDMQFYIIITYNEDVINFINDLYSSGALEDLDHGELICEDDITYELVKVEEQ